ncbi:hypothetical protein F4776DRAFT_666924 [Hypoxylon sp. NC0597]|nr:hypothetical protein F4776DRAFT_666924 [Hypoxylon sp. NC0597]
MKDENTVEIHLENAVYDVEPKISESSSSGFGATTFGALAIRGPRPNTQHSDAVTGAEMPPTDVEPSVYTEMGYPFLEKYEEQTAVEGDFDPIEGLDEINQGEVDLLT